MTFSLTRDSWLLKSPKVRTTSFAGETKSLFLSSLVPRVLSAPQKVSYTKFKFPPDSRDLIFRPISKGKDSCKLIAPDKPISYSTMRQAFRRDLKTIGADPSKFGLHSLLSDGATMAANSGVSDRVFLRYGRWKSTKESQRHI